MKIAIIIGLVLAVVIVGIGASIPTTYLGSEFCPQTFELRTFTYSKTWFGPYGMNRAAATNVGGSSISQHLQPAVGLVRWDLVSGGSVGMFKDSDSRILVQYLEAKNSSWDLSKWSDEHPDVAAKLWPKVQWLATQNLYFAIPELIRSAQSKDDVIKFERFANRHALKAAMEQTRYLIAIKLTDDKRILLYRLTQWLMNQTNYVLSLEDEELLDNYNSLVEQTKLATQGFQDGTLTNEEQATTVQSPGAASSSTATP